MAKREYTLGLPVTVTVNDNGEVTYLVHTYETGLSLVEDEEATENMTEVEIQDDQRAVEIAHRFGTHRIS